jgi:PAT family beta-lactamase induction signal transducer AmpG
MASSEHPSLAPRHPLVWVPTLYFAQGLPFAVVAIMASIMYKKMGISNEDITYWTGMMGFAWVFKPLWSPLLEAARSKKAVVVACQALGGAALLTTALVLPLQGFFTFSVAILTLVAFTSATHDIVADGIYIDRLSKFQQTIYSGWLGAFWNGGKLFVQGALVGLAGELEGRLSQAASWSITTAVAGIILILAALYHAWAVPAVTIERQERVTLDFIGKTTWDVLVTFCKKPGVLVAVAFIILFRLGEGQVQTIGRLFLLEPRATGGLGLSTTDMAVAYGAFSTLAFIGGSILGGYFAAWLGLKRAMFPLILAMNFPSLTFLYLAIYVPTDIYLVTAALCVEMFGYGFGFVGLTLYIMQVVAPGKYKTAHYAVGTGVMALGFNVAQMASGKIQALLGYQNFFIWGVASAIPVLVMSLLVPMPGKTTANSEEEANPDGAEAPVGA